MVPPPPLPPQLPSNNKPTTKAATDAVPSDKNLSSNMSLTSPLQRMHSNVAHLLKPNPYLNTTNHQMASCEADATATNTMRHFSASAFNFNNQQNLNPNGSFLSNFSFSGHASEASSMQHSFNQSNGADMEVLTRHSNELLGEKMKESHVIGEDVSDAGKVVRRRRRRRKVDIYANSNRGALDEKAGQSLEQLAKSSLHTPVSPLFLHNNNGSNISQSYQEAYSRTRPQEALSEIGTILKFHLNIQQKTILCNRLYDNFIEV